MNESVITADGFAFVEGKLELMLGSRELASALLSLRLPVPPDTAERRDWEAWERKLRGIA